MHQIQDTLTMAEGIVLQMHELNAQVNQQSDEYNFLCDELDSRDERIAEMQLEIDKRDGLLARQDEIIKKAVEVKIRMSGELNVANAIAKDLQKLDPKRLVKVNKVQKAKIVELKATISTVEGVRKELSKTNKELSKAAVNAGHSAFHMDADKNAIRILPGIYIGENNTFNGVVGSPVIEFMHHARGVCLQGSLNLDGRISWADPTDILPSPDMTLVACDKLTEYCKLHKLIK